MHSNAPTSSVQPRKIEDGKATGIGFWVAEQIVIRGCLMGWLLGLLAFLIEIRAIFFAGHRLRLDWVAGCFVFAIILIETTAIAKARKLTYSVIIVVVLFWFFTMVTSVQGSTNIGAWLFANMLIVGLIWMSAHTLTRPFQLQDGRISVEEVQQRWITPGRLFIATMLLFALAEPLVLRGHPDIGPRALIAMMLTMASAGVLFAAQTGIENLQRAYINGLAPTFSPFVTRTFIGVVLSIGLVLGGLGTPGLTFTGTGDILQTAPRTTESGSQASDAEDAPPAEQKESKGNIKANTPADTVQSLANVGAKIAFLVALLLGLIAFAWLIRAAWRWHKGMGTPWTLPAMPTLTWPWHAGPSQSPREDQDPWAPLVGLDTLNPTEAAKVAYGCFMVACEAMGTPRPMHTTPSEFARRLPSPLRPIRSEIRTLTRAYVSAHYRGNLSSEEWDDGRVATSSISSRLPTITQDILEKTTRPLQYSSGSQSNGQR